MILLFLYLKRMHRKPESLTVLPLTSVGAWMRVQTRVCDLVPFLFLPQVQPSPSRAHRHVSDIQATDPNSIHVQVLPMVLPGPSTGLEVCTAGPASHLEKRTQKETPGHQKQVPSVKYLGTWDRYKPPARWEGMWPEGQGRARLLRSKGGTGPHEGFLEASAHSLSHFFICPLLPLTFKKKKKDHICKNTLSYV